MVGARIRQLRLEEGLSQESLALESGLSRNMIIGIEWGKKSVAYERLWDIASVLGCNVADLLVTADRPAVSIPYRGGRRAMQSTVDRETRNSRSGEAGS
ncbi:helix-turn-helix domain-containing protein [Arthrobacter sp. ISL-69]|uniref:helix-turn-helix domain-containing protein n=1 Tax=Arthrobacter sp. ISL-69 TaxID=2819113 RepID=UPI0037BE9D15